MDTVSRFGNNWEWLAQEDCHFVNPIWFKYEIAHLEAD